MDTILKNRLIRVGIDPNTLTKDEIMYIEAIEMYYGDDIKTQPIMSDAQFDLLEKRVKESNPEIVKFVGSKAKGTDTHPSPMLSLKKINIYDNDDFGDEVMGDLAKYFAKLNPTTSGYAEFKYDGNAINLIYRDGTLSQALTRTDSETGFDKKYKLQHIVPYRIPVMGIVEVRGEIVIKTSDFESNKKNWQELGFSREPANERNYVAGILGSDDVRIERVRELVFMAVEMRVHDGNDFSYPYNIEEIIAMGFNKDLDLPRFKCNTIDEFISLYPKMLEYRQNETTIRLDGIVLKLDEGSRLQLGFNRHDPNWAVAVKFPPEEAITTITGIENSVGNDGEIYPKAILNPIEIDGSTVNKATLHNWGSPGKKGTYPGARVIIVKGGDIIPQIFAVIRPSDAVVLPPSECPECGSPTKFEDPHLWCTNESCPAREIGKMEDAVKILKIKGIGEATIRLLNKAGIHTIEDILNPYKMDETALVKSGHFVQGRSLDKVIEAAQSMKSCKLSEAIAALKITDVGTSLSEELAKHYAGQQANFKGANKNAVARMTDKESSDYKRMKAFLTQLNDLGVNVTVPAVASVVFEMTGDPPVQDGMKHKGDYQAFLETKGWKKGSINKAIVLLTDSHSSNTGKMKTARDKGITIMTYTEAVESFKQ